MLYTWHNLYMHIYICTHIRNYIRYTILHRDTSGRRSWALLAGLSQLDLVLPLPLRAFRLGPHRLREPEVRRVQLLPAPWLSGLKRLEMDGHQWKTVEFKGNSLRLMETNAKTGGIQRKNGGKSLEVDGKRAFLGPITGWGSRSNPSSSS